MAGDAALVVGVKNRTVITAFDRATLGGMFSPESTQQQFFDHYGD
jgi:hypothetical protein